MASYRAGEYLGDTARGETFDYTRKEGVEWSAIFAPVAAPEWVRDRSALWNGVELAEIRKDARLAREIEASLPREASPEQWQAMCGELAEHFTRYGLVVDVSIHKVKARDGGDNPHAHFLIADRPVDAKGFRGSKTSVRFLNSDLALKGWRQGWEDITNRALEAAGREERVSLTSYQKRGIDREPTRPLGPKASALEKRGIATPEGDRNRRIVAENALREERRKLGELEGGDARPAASGERLAGQTGEWWESYYRRIDAIKKHQERVASGEQPQAYERNPASWSEFSARVGAEVDAARDAVHRFRQKEDIMSDKSGRAAAAAPAAPGTDQNAAAVAARLSAATRSAVGQAGATLRAHGAQLRGATSPREVGDLARPLTPQGDRANVTQRYRARTQDGHDSPRMPRVPPETRNAAALGARLSESARQDAARAGVTLLQQNHATMQQRQAPAAARDDAPLRAALDKIYSGEVRDDVALRAALAERFAGKDTGLETKRQQAQTKENERER